MPMKTQERVFPKENFSRNANAEWTKMRHEPTNTYRTYVKSISDRKVSDDGEGTNRNTDWQK